MLKFDNNSLYSLQEIFQKNIPGIRTIGRAIEFSEDMTINAQKSDDAFRNNLRESGSKHLNAIINIDTKPFETSSYNIKLTAKTANKIHIQNLDAFGYCLNAGPLPATSECLQVLLTRRPVHASFLDVNENTISFPLYILSEGTTMAEPNFNERFIHKLAQKTRLTFVPDKQPEGNVCMAGNQDVRYDFRIAFSPVNVLDCIYALLHLPANNKNRKMQVKDNLPAIPLPEDSEIFWKLVELGEVLRKTHLFESPEIIKPTVQFHQKENTQATCRVTTEKISWEPTNENETTGLVRINKNHQFQNIPKIAWEFTIGSYQPAQEWLINRSGRLLLDFEIRHYIKIIIALQKTHQLMQEIDKKFFNT